MLFRTLPFVPVEPLSVWEKIHPQPRHGFFLGSSIENSRQIFFSAGEPSRLIEITTPADKKNLNRVKTMAGKKSSPSDMPRLVGFFGFEAGRLFDPGLARLPEQPHPLKTPAALFGEYLSVVRVDFQKMETTIVAPNISELERIMNGVRRRGVASDSTPTFLESLRLKPLLSSSFRYISQSKFSKKVMKAKQAIARGDIYQANLSIRFESPFRGDPVQLYRRLSQKNPSPYAALLKMGPRWIVSSSPELLVSVEGKKIKTRPIAGTRPRGRTEATDNRMKGRLLLSPKERAEHIMLVDLERNDLGRVSRPGSVRVSEKFSVEKYSHVMHIVSEVTGTLAKGKTSFEAVEALFPGGTITGCPKISSVKTISDLEGSTRGPFYGSAGYFAWNGDAQFNILIRTALIQNKKATVQAGAGIVADSNPAREYRESLAKAQALLDSISGAC